MAKPTQSDPQFKLRMPASLKLQIEDAASSSNRSMNAEIVRRLEKSFDAHQEVAQMTIHLDLAEIDQDDLQEKLKILAMHVKEMQIAVKVNTEMEEVTEIDGEYIG